MNETKTSQLARFWFHGASIGDLKGLKPVVDRVTRRGEDRSVVTFWTREALRVADSMYGHLRTRRAPLPLQIAAQSFIRFYNPQVCVLEYLELYPAWVFALVKNNRPVGVINGRVTHRSVRIAPLLRKAAQNLSFFAAQTPVDAEMAERIGVRHSVIEVTGSTKYDGILYGSRPTMHHLLEQLGQFDVVVGSIHPDEEEKLCHAIKGFSGRVLIAPRYLRQVKQLTKRLRSITPSVALRSQGNGHQARLVVLDTMGELHASYGLAPWAIVGGTFGRRNGQNLFEPIAMGAQVVFGPSTSTVFDQADTLKSLGNEAAASFEDAFCRVVENERRPSLLKSIRSFYPPCAPVIAQKLLNGRF